MLVGGVILGLGQSQAFASPGDYNYISVKSGNWNDPTTWAVRAKALTSGAFTPLQSSAISDIPDATAGTIRIMDQHVVTVTADQAADQLTINDGGSLVINSEVTLDIADDAGTVNDFIVNGILKNAGFVVPNGTAKIFIGTTGIYQHNYTTSFGAIPSATWNPSSTLEFIGYTSPTGTPVGFGQSFGNVKWNTPNAATDINLNGALTSTIRGNFDVAATNGRALTLSGNANYALIINGDLNLLNNSILNITNGNIAGNTISLTLKGNLNISSGADLTSTNSASVATLFFNGTGDLLINSGTLNTTNLNVTVANSGIVSLKSPVSIEASRTFKVLGQLDMGTNIISGAGDFDVAIGTLSLASPDGLTTSPTASGNVQVTGSRFFRTSSTYIYNGAVAQVTGNGLPGQVAGLTIDNNAGLTLTKTVKVNVELRLTDGIINTNGKNLTVGSNGTLIPPTGDKTSFINGPLTMTVATPATTSLNFPVGKNGVLRPISLEISQFDTTSTTYTVEQFTGTYPAGKTLPSGIDRISSVRYFRITQLPATGLIEGVITMNFGEDDMVNDLNTLSIAKTTTSNSWVDLGAGPSMGTTTSSGSMIAFFTEFSDFVLANKTGGTNPLPVELLSFQAKAAENATNLDWETASEKNSSHFEIQRSQDARTFEIIGTEKAQGNSQHLKRYAFADKNPLAGLAYYRLKQVDLDGTVAYSKIEQVNNQAGKPEIRLYPNPTTGNLSVTATTSMDQIRIVNALGQEVYSNSGKLTAYETVDVSALPNGVYQVIIGAGKSCIIQKFVKASL
ncbi:T9SS type A sorting domain-containing protein [Adhaeribacter terreus]|uniref:T9SS type A sorting domain-containing protein n=1 Tax=Adhaeribacter terreus TaxID=529703 RepID=A0ABW0EFB3_9BACT